VKLQPGQKGIALIAAYQYLIHATSRHELKPEDRLGWRAAAQACRREGKRLLREVNQRGSDGNGATSSPRVRGGRLQDG